MNAKTEEKLAQLMGELESAIADIDRLKTLRGEIEAKIISLMPAPEKGDTVSDIIDSRKITITYKNAYSFIALDKMSHETIMVTLPARVKYEVDVRKAKAILELGEASAQKLLKKHLVIKPQKPAVKIGEFGDE